MRTRVVQVLLQALVVAVLCAGSALGASVAGTQWEGVDSDGDHYTWWFRSDGSVDYTSPSGHFTGASRWTQNGRKVQWQLNNGFAHYTAWLEGTHLRGKAKNVNGHTWKFELVIVK